MSCAGGFGVYKYLLIHIKSCKHVQSGSDEDVLIQPLTKHHLNNRGVLDASQLMESRRIMQMIQ